MEAAATASIFQSSIAAFRPSNSIGRSGNLSANGPAGFLRLSPGFHFSIKVLFCCCWGFGFLMRFLICSVGLGFWVYTLCMIPSVSREIS